MRNRRVGERITRVDRLRQDYRHGRDRYNAFDRFCGGVPAKLKEWTWIQLPLVAGERDVIDMIATGRHISPLPY